MDRGKDQDIHNDRGALNGRGRQANVSEELTGEWDGFVPAGAHVNWERRSNLVHLVPYSGIPKEDS